MARLSFCLMLLRLWFGCVECCRGDHPEKPEQLAPAVEGLSLSDARRAIVDDSLDPYFSRLHRLEIAALTGRPVVKGVSLLESRDEARSRFCDAALGISRSEQESLQWLVEGVVKRISSSFPLFARQPWRFVKVKSNHCGGFPHTRGFVIFLNEGIIRRIVALKQKQDFSAAENAFGTLLFHEQMHVLQRIYPDVFRSLYEKEFRLVHASVEEHDWIAERRIVNPDATQMNWIVPSRTPGRAYGMVTLLREDRDVPRMGADFYDVAVELQGEKGVYHVVADDEGVPITHEPFAVPEIRERFSTPRGVDHPNEHAAYRFEQLLRRRYFRDYDEKPGDDSLDGSLQRFDQWCRAHLIAAVAMPAAPADESSAKEIEERRQ
ncbi:MAG: hypothetical protein KDA42_09360 [Planctomycetales bacterium]|nr:hypothetical protein [Planctomycetales bacterium]